MQRRVRSKQAISNKVQHSGVIKRSLHFRLKSKTASKIVTHRSTIMIPRHLIGWHLFNLGPPARLATCAERGRGPLRTSIIGNTLTSKFRFYHPYILAPQNDHLDEKIQKITFVCSVSARFEELAEF